MEFDVDGAHAWVEKNRQKKPVKAAARMTVEPPRVHRDGQMYIRVREFELRLTGIPGVRGCLDVRGIEDALNEQLPKIGELAPEISVSVPDCIEVSNKKFLSLRECKGFPDPREGLASNETPGIGSKIVLDMQNINPRIVDGNLVYFIHGREAVGDE